LRLVKTVAAGGVKHRHANLRASVTLYRAAKRVIIHNNGTANVVVVPTLPITNRVPSSQLFTNPPAKTHTHTQY